MRSRSFFKNLSWLLALNLLVKPAWIFLIDRQVQNTVGHEAYGKYFALLGLSYMLFFLADAGLSTFMNQRLAGRLPVHPLQLLQLKAILLLLYFISAFFLAWLTHMHLNELLFYILLIQVLNSLFIFLRSILTAEQYFFADAWFSVIDKLLMCLICGIIIYTSFFNPINLLLFVQVQAGCTALALLALIIFLVQKKWMPTGRKEDIGNIIRAVTPFALIILLMSTHYRLDGFMLERIHPNGPYEAGVYASGYRLLDAGNMIGYLVASFLLPFIARHQYERHEITAAILHTRHALLLSAFSIAGFSVFFAPWIRELLYHHNNSFDARIITLCLCALPAYYLVHIYGTVLTATGNTQLFIRILVVSVLINCLANLVLIPRFGALGCGMAALASQYFCGLATCLLSSRRLNLAVGWRSIWIYLLSVALLALLFYAGKMAVSNVWIILAAAAVFTLLLVATQLRYIKKYLA
jgi:O-antigen/teichoic acid export membrane protein